MSLVILLVQRRGWPHAVLRLLFIHLPWYDYEKIWTLLASNTNLSHCIVWPEQNIHLWPRPHYARRIWIRSFISTVGPTVHTNPSRKRSFSKTLFKPALYFSVDGKHFENETFRKRWGQPRSQGLSSYRPRGCDEVTIVMIFSWPRFAQSQIQNFLRRSVDGKHLMRFQSETSVFSVDAALFSPWRYEWELAKCQGN